MLPSTTPSIVLLLFIFLTACSPTAQPDQHPSGTPVLLNAGVGMGETWTNMDFALGPRASQMFLDMLTNTPAQANPSSGNHGDRKRKGVFTVRGTNYVWFEESVVRDDRRWSGPLLDRLNRDSPYEFEYMRELLGKIEANPNIVTLTPDEEWLLDTKQQLMDLGPPFADSKSNRKPGEWISQHYIFFTNGWASYEISLGCSLNSPFDGALLLASDGTFYLSEYHYCMGFYREFGPQPRDLIHFLELYGAKYGWRKL